MRSQRSLNELWTRWPRKVSGFTLLELVAVIVIVAILAAVAVPTVGAIGSSRGATAGNQLLRDLSFARQRAIATGVPVWVVFDTGAETWTIKAENPASPGRANAVVLNDPATGHNFVQRMDEGTFEGVTITSALFDSNDEIGFDWLGKPLNESENDLASNGSVTLSSGHVVTVLKGSGLAQLTSP